VSLRAVGTVSVDAVNSLVKKKRFELSREHVTELITTYSPGFKALSDNVYRHSSSVRCWDMGGVSVPCADHN
jgi:hypothetical protein